MTGVDGNTVTLKKADASEIRLPIEKLSKTDQDFIAHQQFGVGKDASNDAVAGDEAKTEDAPDQSTVGSNHLNTFQDLDALIRSQRAATEVVSLINGFLATDGIGEKEKSLARAALPEWQSRAEKQAVRIGTKWMSPDEFEKARTDEIRLIKEAHRLIDIKNDDLARDKFLEASKANPQAVRADFYLGLLNALVAHHPPDAEDHFRECAKRLARDQDLLSGIRKADYVATLNNLAIAEVRLHKYSEAIGLWRRALAIAPFTPELVQNLGLMTEAAYLPKGMRTTAGNLYAKVAVENSLGRFDNHVGWLYIPYIDTLDGSMDSKGDEEMVTVAWCTGFSLGGDYVLTSRYPMAEADRVVVHDGANTFEVPIGKVVALSNQSNLALIKIDGLHGNAFSLSSAKPRPLQSYAMIGYREPGFTNETFQSMTANIVDTPNVLRHVETSTIHDNKLTLHVHWFNYRDMLMHDAVTSAGMVGSPLLDSKGEVVGINLGNPPAFGTFGSKFSLAEPAHYAIQFIKPLAPELELRAGTGWQGRTKSD